MCAESLERFAHRERKEKRPLGISFLYPSNTFSRHFTRPGEWKLSVETVFDPFVYLESLDAHHLEEGFPDGNIKRVFKFELYYSHAVVPVDVDGIHR